MKTLTLSFLAVCVVSLMHAGARPVPERADDFAFENDRVAFRVYGPALRDKPEDSGVDCWAKRVETPVIDAWYAGEKQGISYHKDHGQGYDFYHVGSSLGCGGIGLWINGKLVTSDVYRSARVIESAPDRAVFELEYVFDKVPGLREVRRITLEPGDQLFRADSQFFRDGLPTKVAVAVGLTTHDGKAKASLSSDGRRVTTWETVDGAGFGTAVLLPYRRDVRAIEIKAAVPDASHALILAETDVSGRISYYAGFAWAPAGRIADNEAWTRYLDGFEGRLPQHFFVSAREHMGPSNTYDQKIAGVPYPQAAMPGPSVTADLEALVKRGFVKSLMHRVTEFQERAYGGKTHIDWKAGTYYTGVFAAYSATKDAAFREAAVKWGTAADWKIGKSPFYADDICMGQTMLDLYLQERNPRYIADLVRVLEPYFDKKTLVQSEVHGPVFHEQEMRGRALWWWCDALYMAPPVLARMYAATSDTRYLDLLHRLYWDTTDFLFDPEASLFFRDDNAKPKDIPNTPESEKIFWSRGNGWVYAGLVRVLDHLPANDPYRTKYLDLYHRLTRKIVTLQSADGLWRSWLNRPDIEQTPETSGTAFFTFGLLAGINRGWLDRDSYLPVALRGWRGLVGKIDTNGRLGFAQLVDDRPNAVRPESFIDYTHGAFLLAASELYAMDLDAAKLQAVEPKHESSLLLSDAAWTWYNDERVLVADKHLYLGGVDHAGRVKTFLYRIRPGGGAQVTRPAVELSSWTERDDHNNPAFLRFDDKVLAVYSRHNTASVWNWRTAVVPTPFPDWNRYELQWTEEKSFSTGKAPTTYANLARLSAENGRIYNFFRADGFDPNVTWSDDGAASWAPSLQFIASGDNRTRPYVKYADNGRDRIDLIYTDGHPRDEARNSVYHLYYQAGSFHTSDGKVVRKLADARERPIAPGEGTRVYDGSGPLGRGWVHDLEYDAQGQPTAAFISSPDGDEGGDLRYWVSRFDAKTGRWNVRPIAYAGSYLYPHERHYAGGIALDPDNPDVVYISTNVDPATGRPGATGRYQLFRGRGNPAGGDYVWEQLTFDADRDNLRPIVPRGHGRGDRPCVIWLRGHYRSYRNYRTDIYGIGF